ncbi:hypothetical protein I4F81_011452 [Pyropia yezoensis]|uniref:Uncharacterized protein n=1 Tax=Pyropia yezoensis TaxID=2788 RepID=A0ACC3CGB4_PYRYE|nr:hypothetical protein I4F81_011452 [Neopyropia yezoensis]
MKSAETREHLVRMVREEGSSVAAAASDLNLSVRSATRYLGYFRDTGGEFHCDPARWNRHYDNLRDDPQLREAVLETVDSQPELFLDELTDAVNEIAARLGGVDVFQFSVARILAQNGYTRKVIERAFITRNEASRAAWVAMQCQIPLRCRVYVDEAHRVGRAADRHWAWSLRGERAECYVSSSAGVKTSFCVAMAHDRVLDWVVTRPPPGQTAVDFLLFLGNLVLPRMREVEAGRAWDEQRERCVLILDNARIHDEVALASVRAAGVVVLLLPPYSPDFNPVEDVFSVGSSWLRRWSSAEQFNAFPMLTIDTMLNSITGSMCEGFVKAAVRRYNLYVP